MITMKNGTTSLTVEADVLDCGATKIFFPHKTKYQLLSAGMKVNRAKLIAFDDVDYHVLSVREITNSRTNYVFFIASTTEEKINYQRVLVEYTKDNSKFISTPRSEEMTTFTCGSNQIFLLETTKAKLIQAKFKLGPASKFITELGVFAFEDVVYTVNPKYPVIKTRKL